MSRCDAVLRLIWTLLNLLLDVGRLMTLGVRSSAALKAENLFLRKQLALYQERQIRPRRASNVTKVTGARL